jgi:ubiquinone/menaquinone biosynthesis C-methylase UbiE
MKMTHLTRYQMYKRIKEQFPEKMKGKILCISGAEGLKDLIHEDAEVTNTSYPEIDFQNMPFDCNSFDYIISDQVLEHLENPKKAIDESYRVLKNGGIAIHTTCFINYVHKNPIDYWRFSPDALRFLCSGFSDVLQCEGWGNRISIFLSWTRFRMMDIDTGFKRAIATKNESKYPIVTWIIAKK